MSGERMLADRLEIRDAYPSRGTADVKFVYADEMSVILAALRSPSREDVIEECARVADSHEDFWRGRGRAGTYNIERKDEAGNIAAALRALKNRNDQRTPQERTTFDATPSDGPKPAVSTSSDDKPSALNPQAAWPFPGEKPWPFK